MLNILRNLLLLTGLLLDSRLGASAQVFDWAQLARNAGSNGAIGQGGTADQAGNSYIGFSFKDSARVAGQRLLAQAGPGGSMLGSGVHLVKYDSMGRVKWIKVLLGVKVPLGSMASGLKAGPANAGLFVTGVLSAGATWGGVPIPAAAAVPAGQYRGFYGKCDNDGTLLWTRPLPTEPNTQALLNVDGLGNCYVVGTVSPIAPAMGTGVLGGLPLDSTQMYLVGNNAAGTGEWIRRLHATPKPYISRYDHAASGLGQLLLGPKAAGGCLLFGTYNQTLFFGNSAVLNSRVARNTFDEFLATVSPAGELSWVRPGRLGTTPANPVPGAAAAAADATGNYYVTGGSDTGLNSIGYQNTVIGVAKYSSTGNLLWLTNQATQVANTSGVGYNYNHGNQLVVDGNGEVTIWAFADTRPELSVPAIGNFELRDVESLIHFTATGVPQWVTVGRNAGDLHPQLTYSYNDLVSIDADAAGNLYYITAPGSVSPNSPATGNVGLTPPTFLLGELTQVGAGISVARIGTRHNTVRGRLYLDANGNGTRDAGEGPFPRSMVLECIQPTIAHLGTFDTSNNFTIYVGAGTYRLAPPPPPLHYALTEPAAGDYTGNFVGYGRVDTARHFGYKPIAGQADVRVQLTPYGAARPGFSTRYRVTVDNVGTVAASGTATATLDAHLAYLSSTAGGSRAGQTVTWTYANLAPFARREFDVVSSLAADVALGTQLTSTAAAPLPADVVSADNEATAVQTVTGSFDPNDLTVNYARLTPAQVAAGQPLDYTIRFQNVGTDTAFTVVVTDTLNFRLLALNTFQLVAQSPSCVWSLSGQGDLTVRFLNAKLPYRNQDALHSQGFVQFRVQPQATLARGEVIPNHARITFDYNAPLRTNTTTTTVDLVTAALAAHPSPAWSAYPNPATDALTVATELATAGPVRLELLDALGRAVWAQTLVAPAGPLRQLLNLRGLPAGLYVLCLTPPTGPALTRRVVRE